MSKFYFKPAQLVFWLATAYALYRISAVFYRELPLLPSLLILLCAGLLSMLVLALDFLKTRWRGTIGKSTLLLIALIVSILFSILLQFVFLRELSDETGRSSHQFVRSIFFFGVIWLAVGAVVQRANFEKSWLISFGLIAFLGVAVALNIGSGFFVSYGALIADRVDEQELNHLVVGEAATWLLLVSFAFCPSKIRILVALASVAILFSLGGRTSLFTFSFALLIFQCLRGRIWGWGLGVLLILGVGVLFLYFGSSGIDDFLDGGVAYMLLADGLGADESAVARQYLLEMGLSGLPSQILMGDPNFLIEKFGTLGGYIHNLLSAWQLFGFFPFVLFLTAISYSGAYIWRNRVLLSGVASDFGVLLFIYSVLSVASGKFIGFTALWCALGFWLARRSGSADTKS